VPVLVVLLVFASAAATQPAPKVARVGVLCAPSVSDPIFLYPSNRVPDLAAQAGLPSISLMSSFAQGGGLISYGPDSPALARLGAHYVDRILKGAKPAELPIEQPSKFLLVINLKTRNRSVSKSRRPFSPARTR
jgi:putative ABC transport system substrate-binding protein